MEQQAKEREESKKLVEEERTRLSEVEIERNELQETKAKLLVDFNDLQQSYENVGFFFSEVISTCYPVNFSILVTLMNKTPNVYCDK